jgi:hypothetical protein
MRAFNATRLDWVYSIAFGCTLLVVKRTELILRSPAERIFTKYKLAVLGSYRSSKDAGEVEGLSE